SSRNRNDRIRTCGLCVPNAAIYQTEPHSETIYAFFTRLNYYIESFHQCQALFRKKAVTFHNECDSLKWQDRYLVTAYSALSVASTGTLGVMCSTLTLPMRRSSTFSTVNL